MSERDIPGLLKANFRAGAHPLDNEWNRRVIAFADDEGKSIFLVGGFLRDAVISPRRDALRDLDYAVEGGNAVLFARNLAEKLDGHFVLLDGANDTARVVVEDGTVLDFAGCVGGSIESDLRRRDFTINALAWHQSHPDELIDTVGAMRDIKDLQIRAISESAFMDDPLRVLRAFRFSASLNATIDAKTLAWAKKHSGSLKNVAAERINLELFTIFNGEKAGDVTNQLAFSGALEVIFPELTHCRKVTPNSFHHLGLFEHSIATVSELDARLPQLPDWVKEKSGAELSHGVTRLAAARVACILHDIGKPDTWVITPEGKHTFVGHDKVGAEMTERIGERLKWSRPVERLITKLVQWHLRPGQLFHQGPPTDKAVRRFYRNVGNDVPELMLVAFADLGATRGPGLMGENRINLEKDLLALLLGYRDFIEELGRRSPLLNGNDIMKLLSLPPGPIVGDLLKALEEARDLKEVLNRSQAEDFIKRRYAETYSK
ncbi:MAG TPA: HDIG domain-containing metalloprotein [Candidatus Obscuribacterales bacterium]